MLLNEIGTYLASSGFGALATAIFLGEMPVSPINCIALFESNGRAPMSTHSEAYAHERPELHVVVRDAAQVAARTKLETIVRVLAQVRNTYLSDTFYLAIMPISNPYQAVVDENKNHVFVCRFSVLKVPSILP